MTLQEMFGKLLKEEGEAVGGEGVEGEEGGADVRNLRLAEARLKERLRHTQDLRQLELQESKVYTSIEGKE